MRAGYKQTEVGVIPEDWEVSPLGDALTLQRGFDLPKRFRRHGTIPIVTSSGTEDFHDQAAAKGPGIVTGRYGTIGKVYFVEGDYWPLNTTLWLRDYHGNDPLWAFRILQTVDFLSHSGKSGVPGVNRNDVHEEVICVPPLSEQHAIAGALSDADGLIAALEGVIAKKRDLKQAAMQQLLTGKTRLPGFSGEWEVKRLGDFGQTYGGLTGKTKVDFGHGAARYIPFMNVMNNSILDPNDLELVDVKPSENQNKTQKGDLFFNGSSETPSEVGMCALLDDDVSDTYLNSFCFGFRLKDLSLASGPYLTYLFRSQVGRELLASLAQGATRYNLSKRALLNVSFYCPSTAEQTAIAEVLSDMDADLAALEARAAKARAVKQGMMQQLLTGQVRLI